MNVYGGGGEGHELQRSESKKILKEDRGVETDLVAQETIKLKNITNLMLHQAQNRREWREYCSDWSCSWFIYLGLDQW